DRVVNDQVHELVEALGAVSDPSAERGSQRGGRTLILPSIRMESCSYSQTLTVEFWGGIVSRRLLRYTDRKQHRDCDAANGAMGAALARPDALLVNVEGHRSGSSVARSSAHRSGPPVPRPLLSRPPPFASHPPRLSPRRRAPRNLAAPASRRIVAGSRT